MENREAKNGAVFGGRPDMIADARVPVISAADKVKADLGVDIPIELVPLPSLGKCYPPNHPLCGKQSVEIRAMTSREEAILMNKTYLKKGTAVTELLRSCLVDRSIDPTSLLIGDRNALLVAIRITGYGAEYPVEIKCSECDEKFENTFDLSQLPIQTLDLDPSRSSSNYFEFSLPVTKKVVGVKFLTGLDEENMTVEAENKKRLKLQADPPNITALLNTVVTLDGSEDRTRISQFINFMPAKDSLALRTFLRHNEPTIVFKQAVRCPNCDSVEEVTVPLGVTFLWPDAGGR
jgi:hypothetical protein